MHAFANLQCVPEPFSLEKALDAVVFDVWCQQGHDAFWVAWGGLFG